MPSSITYSLHQLLQQFTYIKIPMIQRDYAHGRNDAKDVRNSIVSSFVEIYKKRKDLSESKSLNLDFVFGDILTENNNSNFQPLDGQQRLTTLFLLHWYAALCNNQTDVFKQQFVSKDGKSKLSYQVRQSANDFFNKLVDSFPDHKQLFNDDQQDSKYISNYISNQSWFFLSWQHDPTIQSALTMLDAIHHHFSEDAIHHQYACAHSLYEYLTDQEQPLITFQFLPLEGFGLSEDLYIKMNARGKPLTTFENTKAKIEQFIMNDTPLLHEYRKNIDASWSDLLWKYRNQDTNIFDQQFMNLFRHVMIVTHDLNHSNYENNFQLLRDFKSDLPFQRYIDMDVINIDNIQLLSAILNHWSQLQNKLSAEKPTFFTKLRHWGALQVKSPVENTINQYFDENQFIQTIFAKSPAPLTYEQLVIFYAYIKYIQKKDSNSDSQYFKDWMRIISNLARNTVYNRPEDINRSLRFINSILEYIENPLDFFSQLTGQNTSKGAVNSITWYYDGHEIRGSFYEQQVREEILKAQLIINLPEWRVLIEEAESHEYFKGQIEFLFVFAGLFDQWKQTMLITWGKDPEQDEQYRKHFTDYLHRISKIFDGNGINLTNNATNKNPDFIWERALLAKGDYLSPNNLNKSLLFDDDRSFDWKRLLRGSIDGSDTRRLFVKAVLDDIQADTDIKKTLTKIAKNAERDSTIEPWRKMLISEPACIAYCEKRNIRFSGSSEPIYLLKKNQMNGEHVELFSYFHYCQEIKTSTEVHKMLPFKYSRYCSVSDTDSQPHIILSSDQITEDNKSTGNVILKIYSVRTQRDSYEIELVCKSVQLISLDLQGWKKHTNIPNSVVFTKTITNSTEIIEVIKEISTLLTKAGTE